MDTSLFSCEDRGRIVILRYKPRDHLFAADSRAMIESWEVLDRIQKQGKSVILFRMPRDHLSPALVDDFWRRASEAPIDHAPIGGRALPQIVAAADASMQRILRFLRSIAALTIGACEGEVDFDLLGLLLACKYRMCTTDTTFVNRTLRRSVGPGSATPWYLARFLGISRAREVYLTRDSLTAQEALELGIVNQVSETDLLEQAGVAVAERFAEFDRAAVESLVKATEQLHQDLDAYLKKVGTGFGDLPKPS
jgi:enoyl-CoA hydratase/carnithine racemase